jgi:hypothetical protein
MLACGGRFKLLLHHQYQGTMHYPKERLWGLARNEGLYAVTRLLMVVLLHVALQHLATFR